MPLPSGTSISADDINSHLGRSAGSAVSWDTMVRTLSNDNSTPNLNDVRGRAPRHISYASSGFGTGPYSDYGGSGLCEQTTAHSIPNSPWRVVLNTYRANSFIYMELKVIGTHYDIKYNYIIPASLGITSYGASLYSTGKCLSGMLSNGKLIIVTPSANANGNSFGGHGISMIAVTFNTNGSIAGTKVYNSDINGVANPSSVSQTFIGNIWDAGNFHLSVSGNSFAFPIYGAPYSGSAKHHIVKVDASSDTFNAKYVQVSATGDTSTATGMYNDYTGMCKINLQSNGDINVVRPWYSNSIEPVMVNKLSDAGGWSTYNSNRWNFYYSIFKLPYNGNSYNDHQTGGHSPDSTKTINAFQHYYYVDRQKYYYIVKHDTAYYNKRLVSANWYFTGTTSTLTIQKIRSSDNANMCKIGLAADGYLYGTQNYDSKTGTTSYAAYPCYVFGSKSIAAIESDSSGNTYILYKSYYVSGGGRQSYGSWTDMYADQSSPITAQMLFHFSKFDINGNHLWTRILDTGSKQAGRLPYDTIVITGEGAGQYYPESWSILTREEINVVELYMTVGPRYTPTTVAYSHTSNQRGLRSVHFNMQTGDTLTWSSGDAGTLNVENNFTTTTTHSVMPAGGGSNQNMSLIPIQKFTLSTDNSYSNASTFSGSGSWTSFTLSSLNNTLLAVQDGVPGTGTVYTQTNA